MVAAATDLAARFARVALASHRRNPEGSLGRRHLRRDGLAVRARDFLGRSPRQVRTEAPWRVGGARARALPPSATARRPP
eukprot:258815-Pyramimonas_sp.AAC.1